MRISELVKSGTLVWFPKHGLGYVDPGEGMNYGAKYFEEFTKKGLTDIGDEIMQARMNLVTSYLSIDEVLVDVGIGSGLFIEERSVNTFGTDINPWGIHWLMERRLFWDCYSRLIPNACFWDSLEHMEDPAEFLNRVSSGGKIFVSIPIFKSQEHTLDSKHYKPGEHLWYFTEEGFVRYVENLGFNLLESNRIEEHCGREDIGTFVFEKK